jgi:ATP-binding cassette subfamily B protein
VKDLLRALSYAKQLWPYYIGIGFTAITTALMTLAIPFVIKAATDLVVDATRTGQADVRGAAMLAILLFAFDVGGRIVTNIGGYWGDVMAEKLKTHLSVRYYEHLLALPQSYYDNELTGTIINRLNRAITEVTRFLNMFANNFSQMLLTTIMTVVIVSFYSWQLALLVLSIYPIFGWLTTRTSVKWQRLQHLKNHEVDVASGRFAEVVSQIKVVKSYVHEKLELRHFTDHFLRSIDINREQSRYWHNMDVVRGTVLALIFFGIYVLLFTQTVEGKFTIGEMVLLVTLISAVRIPIFSLSFVVDQYQRAVTGSRDFVDVMNTKPAITDQSKAKALHVSVGEVVFDDVSFSYSAEVPVLKSISFTIKPGAKLALVGESGEGKTTISNLLMRLYEPTGGTISIDGVNIGEVTQTSLRKNIATVFQDPSLFSGTIRENIAYGHPSVAKEEVVSAAKAANAHEFISKLENGYDSLVGERGIKLSGGQKQRIAIARAILKNAPLLILDEATSSLDTRSEHLVQDALERLMKDRSTLIIAHRLSTIAHVDTIVTLKNGQVDEVGSPAELAKTGGIYAQLLELQAGTTVGATEKLKDFDMKA